VPKTGIVV